jgi:inosine triphosphate pyrophosphatase
MTLYFITGNDNKFNEARFVFPGLEKLAVDLPEIQSADAQEIIEAKLKEAMKHYDGEFIVEDTSLHFECLNGLPGPLIKWFVNSLGQSGLYDLTRRYGNHRAYVRCLVGYAKDGDIRFFEGVVHGQIVEPRGEMRFAWDSIFQPDGFDRTYAQMTKAEKAEISHRRIALEKLKNYLS